MRFLTYTAIIPLLLIYAPDGMSADANGYTAQYECRAGGPNCNVDVVTLTQQSCQQTITTATTPTNSWSAINWSNDVICIEAGDHTGRGTLTIPASGTSGTYKVLRYYRPSDNNDDLWNQTLSDQVLISALRFSNASYWVVHRLAFTQQRTNPHIEIGAGSTNIILSRILTENLDPVNGDEVSVYIHSTSNTSLQNSVVRNCKAEVNRTSYGVAVEGVIDSYIVNNEIYNCGKQVGSVFSDTPGLVVENNDLYINDYTTNGTKGKARMLMNTNARGTAAKPAKYIQNRIFGMRPCDTSVACSNGGGVYAAGGGYNAPIEYSLIQNNIFFDNSGGWFLVMGPNSSASNNSVIGNIFYAHHSYGSNNTCVGAYLAGGSGPIGTLEVYLNTFIDCTPGTGWFERGGITDSDVRCNAIISSDAGTGTFGSGTQIDDNVYYDTTDSGETNKLTNTVTTRANSTAYSVGAILRTNVLSACTAASNTSCFLYRVIVAGTSAGAPQAYTTKIGGTTVDGTMTVQAIRGPYTFKRKLRTIAGGETVVIPYARAHVSAPETGRCPSTTGSRTGIGATTGALF